MVRVGAIVRHPDEMYPLLKLKMAMKHAANQIPPQPRWCFCYSMLHSFSRSFSLAIHQLHSDFRHAVEDDTSIPTDVKLPILVAFHKHIYDPEWRFSCGTEEYKVLMDEFHHVSTAFLELGKSYQEAIEDITKRMGAGMAKFICKEVETLDDYDEYCHYVSGLVGLGLSRLFFASGFEDLAPDHLSNTMGLFLQKTNIIRDYLEDVNETPKSRMFWPRQIWSKYVDKLEIMAIATQTMCYNNIEVFRGVVKIRHGLTAKIIDRTRTMADVYTAFFNFAGIMKSKVLHVDMNDPNAEKTLYRLDALQKTCNDSGLLNKRISYINASGPTNNSALVVLLLIIAFAIVLTHLMKQTSN